LSDSAERLDLTRRELCAAQAGDAEALETLFARYLPRVRAMVAARMGRTPRQMVDVEDLVQETLQDALLALQAIDPRSEGLFAHWLARCVENNVRDALRRQGAARRGGGQTRRFADLDRSLSESLFPGRELALSQVLQGRELEERIDEALARLGARYREVIVLRARCGLSHEEVAEAMQLRRANTANVLFLRARARLREVLDGGEA